MSKRAKTREKQRRRRRQQQAIIIAIVLGAALILLAIIIWPQLAPLSDIVVPQMKSYPSADGSAMGDPKAPIVIEEFSDFLCSYCSYFHMNTLEHIVEQYVATGQVYFVFNLFPLNQLSQQLAQAGMCAAEQGYFWQYADILYANQAVLSAEKYTGRLLETLAENVNLDIDQFQTCILEERYLDQIQQSYLTGISNGITGTPSFLINGKLVKGAMPFSDFQAEIEAALSEGISSSP
jgi:protein-disulfide isomerase